MNTYIYQADLYCENCTKAIKAEINAGKRGCCLPPHPEDESSFDSDTYPKGPYPDGGGEADSNQHCGTCGVFLENPLTRDGEQYLREMVKTYPEAISNELREFYSYLFVEDLDTQD